MKKTPLILFAAVTLAAAGFLFFPKEKSPHFEGEGEAKSLPQDWFYDQRAFPHGHIDQAAYQDAFRMTRLAKASAAERGATDWQPAGPLNIGGRITDLALHPTDQSIIYAGSASGGIWKSSDGGTNWTPIFDNEGSLSVGDLAIAPSAPNTIYVGTGEANGSFDSGSFYGSGVFKSTDGGQNWEHLGLENTHHIGRIAIDPANAQRVYVAATGVLYGKNGERGLYRTLNGGDSWEKVLYLNDSTACIDVAVNPTNADIVFAATWERIRYPWKRQYGGMHSRIYRSTDGGTTWAQMTNGLPPDSPERGRIGLAISPSDPNTVYASYTTNPITNLYDGIYKSSNGGDSWELVDNSAISDVYSSFGWYFGNIRVDPTDSEQIWCLGVPLYRSFDGGVNWWEATADMHVDFHALEIHPQNPAFVVAGCDGGVYISQDGGSAWSHVETLPITQFYNCEIDYLNPGKLLGGTQDNGSLATSGNLNDWGRFLGGDGFHVIVDPIDNNFVYAEYQYGNLFRSADGGANMEFVFNGEFDSRTNWNTPVVMDPSEPKTLYYGADKLFKSTDQGTSWNAVSADLSDGIPPSGSLSFGTITTIAVSKTDPQTIYVGTDDGNVQVTHGAPNWTNISAGLPKRFVTEAAVHPEDPMTAFVTLSGFRNLDYQPHVLRTTDGGTNWEDISGNLPEIPVNDIIIHPDYPDYVYFIANDLGVWQTIDGGINWEITGSNLPTTVVNDLVFHQPTLTLVAGTYGRSMMTLDVSNVVPTAASELTAGKNAFTVLPNPMGAIATISFEIPHAGEALLEVFALNGRKVETLAKRPFLKGKNEVQWAAGQRTAGVYFVRLKTEDGVLVKKVIAY